MREELSQIVTNEQGTLLRNSAVVSPIQQTLRAAVAQARPNETQQEQNDTGFIPIPEELQGVEPNDFKFLQEYVKFSREWSPRSVQSSHEAVALWVLSAAAAGRVVFNYGRRTRAFLYLFLVAKSTLYAKSTTVGIGNDLLEETGLGRVIIRKGTPQAFFDQCVEKVPADWENRSDEQKQRTLDKLKNAGQRAWYAEEFGAWAEAMLREGSVHYQFRELLLNIFDSIETLEYNTISRGEATVEKPTLSVFAVSTYAHLRRLAAANSPLWRDGLFARFLWITTTQDERPSDEFIPERERKFPAYLLKTLHDYDKMLGVPTVSVSPVFEKTQTGKEKKVVRHDVRVDRGREFVVNFTSEAFDALKRYDIFVRGIIRDGDIPEDLAPNYGRFAAFCARTAVLLASIEHSAECTLRHFRKAVAITERNRRSLHDAYFRLTTEAGENDKVSRTDALLRFIGAMRVATLRDIQAKFRRQYPQGVRELEAELDALVRSGDLHVSQPKKNRKRYAVDVFLLTQENEKK